MFRNAVIAVALLAITTLIGHSYVQSQVYYGVVKLVTPEGLSITAFLAETPDRALCGAANDHFLAPIKRDCKGCTVAMARCARQLDGLELALAMGDLVPHYVVAGAGVRMALVGPAEIAKVGCEQLAAALTGHGVRLAACIPPGAASAKI